MTTMEEKISACMAKIRAAVAAAPSHEELFAGFEAMLRHLSGADEPESFIAPAPSNDTDPPQSAAPTAGDQT